MDFKSDIRFKGIEPFDSKVWLSSPTMHGDEMEYVTKAYETNWMSTVGENINELEKSAATYIGVKHAVALSSGTAALHLAVKLAAERLYGSSSGVSTPDGLGTGGALYGRREHSVIIAVLALMGIRLSLVPAEGCYCVRILPMRTRQGNGPHNPERRHPGISMKRSDIITESAT